MNDSVYMVIDKIIFAHPCPGQSVSVSFCRLICANGIIIVRTPELGNFVGNGFASRYRFWLKACNTVLNILLPIYKLE